ncbi:MAG: GCN5-related N-acetyltransferase [Nocardioidaceae bacterium]|nr:GCN5-related N-acetyltransferase [Nocardioidaceae bacterium]
MPPTLDELTWPKRTERLLIRASDDTDATTTFRYRRLPEVTTWLPRHIDDLAAYVEMFDKPERRDTTLVIEHEGVVVGDLMLRVEDPWSQSEVAEQARGTVAELGWSFDPAYGGRGLATEAVTELLRIAFDEVGVRRVVALCFADNEPSWRLMERVGMRREAHTIADSLHRSGAWLDGFEYALLADEWRAARVSRRA